MADVLWAGVLCNPPIYPVRVGIINHSQFTHRHLSLGNPMTVTHQLRANSEQELYLTSLSLNFLTVKIITIMAPVSQDKMRSFL